MKDMVLLAYGMNGKPHRHSRALPRALLRFNPAEGTADVPSGAEGVARHRGDDSTAARLNGRCDAQECRVMFRMPTAAKELETPALMPSNELRMPGNGIEAPTRGSSVQARAAH